MNTTEIFDLIQIVQNELEAINHHELAEKAKELKKLIVKEFSLI